MRKLYSIITAVAFAVVAYAQGTETFETQNTLAGSYATGSFQGEYAEVKFVDAKNEGNYAIEGKGIMLRGAKNNSSVTFVVANNGVGDFRFQAKKSSATNSARKLVVKINGEVKAEIPDLRTNTDEGKDYLTVVSTLAVDNAPVEVTITYPDDYQGTSTDRQVVIDNVEWSAYGTTLSAVSYEKAKNSLVKNTAVTTDIAFLQDAQVEIVNMGGQVVKIASVKAGQTISVTELPKGVYIVTGKTNRSTVSQKIIKQ